MEKNSLMKIQMIIIINRMLGVRIRCILFSARIKMYWKYKMLFILIYSTFYMDLTWKKSKMYWFIIEHWKVIMDSWNIESHVHFMECFPYHFTSLENFHSSGKYNWDLQYIHLYLVQLAKYGEVMREYE